MTRITISMRIFSLLILLMITSVLQSQVVVNENASCGRNVFPLVTSNMETTVCYDVNDYLVVKRLLNYLCRT